MAKKVKIVKTVKNAFVRVMNDLKTAGTLIGEDCLISDRQLDGKTVTTFNISRFKKLGSVTGSSEVIAKHVGDILDKIQDSEKGRKIFESYGEPKAFYWKTSVSWSKDGVYCGENWEKLVQVWNDTKGDIAKVSQAFGKNQWGEWIVPESSVKNTVNAARKAFADKGMDCPLYAPPEDAKEVTDELVEDMLSDLI